MHFCSSSIFRAYSFWSIHEPSTCVYFQTDRCRAPIVGTVSTPRGSSVQWSPKWVVFSTSWLYVEECYLIFRFRRCCEFHMWVGKAELIQQMSNLRWGVNCTWNVHHVRCFHGFLNPDLSGELFHENFQSHTANAKCKMTENTMVYIYRRWKLYKRRPRTNRDNSSLS